MKYWLMKTEPSSFSIDDLRKCPGQTTGWDGVRNYQVRNMLRDDMKRGDQAFIYHSSCDEPGIAGIAEITREGYPDPTQFDRKHDHYDPKSTIDAPRWLMVDVKFMRRFPRIISLDELRTLENKALAGMLILRAGNRLSITPVEAAHWKAILDIERKASSRR
jgi:predicted RNA-binding protein with PUA-like domain